MSKYTAIPNSVIDNPNMSLAALGLYSWLLCNSDNYISLDLTNEYGENKEAIEILISEGLLKETLIDNKVAYVLTKGEYND